MTRGNRRDSELISETLALLARSDQYPSEWGHGSYRRVIEMLEVEQSSITIRDTYVTNYDRAAKMREAEMKRLADLRIAEIDGVTLLNMGANHAQRKIFRGSRHEWLGDYLANSSPVVGGSACSVAILPARGNPESGGAIGDHDIFDQSPDYEPFRAMNEMWPQDAVSLPLSDPFFQTQKVLVNIENTVKACTIGTVYDAFILLPDVHWERPPGA